MVEFGRVAGPQTRFVVIVPCVLGPLFYVNTLRMEIKPLKIATLSLEVAKSVERRKKKELAPFKNSFRYCTKKDFWVAKGQIFTPLLLRSNFHSIVAKGQIFEPARYSLPYFSLLNHLLLISN